jgi:hypothetical protein
MTRCDDWADGWLEGRQQAIRDAAGEAAIALLAMDGVEFTPEQHNSVVDAILALQDDQRNENRNDALQEKPPPLPPSVGVPERRWFR